MKCRAISKISTMRPVNKCVTVYVPNNLENNNVGFLPGFIRKDASGIKFYISDNRLRNESAGCIGYCGLAQVQPCNQQPVYWIRVSFSEGQFQVSHIFCNQIEEYKLLYVFYDFETFKRSHLIFLSLKPDNDFYYLSRSLYSKKITARNNEHSYIFLRAVCYILISARTFCQKHSWWFKPVTCFSTFQHIESTIIQIYCILDEAVRKRMLSIQMKHVLVTRILDIILGALVLHWLLLCGGSIPIKCTDTVILRIGDLLRFLMGSPVGLKLNAAFNKALGNFFLYHMTLWNSFLKVAADSVDIGTVAGTALGFICSFGLTQQLAVASDLLALTTFHVHCIYVYAARLYGAQIYGLIALWRLFLGRKRNPLKGRVDTYR